jgi:microcystin-dependent protein
MSQHDYDISKVDANVGVTVRAAINAALQALASNNSGTGDPAITYAYQFKIDTSVSPAVMYLRNSTNTAWIRWATINASTGVLTVDKAVDSNKVKVSSTDTTSAYLNEKIVAGTGITLTKGNTGANETYTVSFSGTGVPTGAIMAFPVATPPDGYLECNGSAVSRTTYASLFAFLGTTYGVGDGSTTFNLPNYKGMFLRGWANGSSNDPDRASRTDRGDGTVGDNIGTRQGFINYTHAHSGSGYTGSGGNHIHYISTWTNVNQANTVCMGGAGNGPYANAASVSAGGDHTHYFSFTTSNAGGNETRPINVNVLYCIKY